MPPRLSKRQQRESEEIAALAGPSSRVAESSEDEDQKFLSQVSVGTGFAAVSSGYRLISQAHDHSFLRQKSSRKVEAKTFRGAQSPAK
jgi:hypothetical protein